MKTLFKAIATLLFLQAITAAANDFEIKGIKLGLTEPEVESIFGNVQNTHANGGCSGSSDRSCSYNPKFRDMPAELKSIAGYPVDFYAVRFESEKAFYIYIKLHTNAFDSVANALISKYGQPSTKTQEVLQNKLGASFVNDIYKWQSAGQTLSVRRHAGRVDAMAINLTNDATIERKAKLRAEKNAADI